MGVQCCTPTSYAEAPRPFELPLERTLNYSYAYSPELYPQSLEHELRPEELFRSKAQAEPYLAILSPLLAAKRKFSDFTFAKQEGWTRLFALDEADGEVRADFVSLHDRHLAKLPEDSLYSLAAVLRGVARKSPRSLDRVLTRPNALGFHVVVMNINGANKSVIIDDYLPSVTVGSRKLPQYLQANEGAGLSLSLIEKAWAKVHGGYDKAAKSNNPAVIASQLFGLPFSNHELTSQSEAVLQQHVKGGELAFVVMGESSDLVGNLIENQIFSVVGAKKVKLEGDSHEVYCLESPVRNSLKTKLKCEPGLMAEFGVEDGPEHLNFLTREELLSCANRFIRVFSKGLPHSLSRVVEIDRPVYYRLTLQQDCDLVLRLLQYYKGYVLGEYAYENVHCDVVKGRALFSEGDEATASRTKETYLLKDHRGLLEKGTYLVRLFVSWNNSAVLNWATLLVHASAQGVELAPEPEESGRAKYEAALGQVAVQDSVVPFKLDTSCPMKLVWLGQKAIFYMANRDRKSKVNASVRFEGCVNLLLEGESLGGTKEVEFGLQPMKEKVLVLAQRELALQAKLGGYKVTLK